MASHLPIPAPPRTPTPPTPIPEEPEYGLGMGEFASQTLQSHVTYDSNTLSPMRDVFNQYGSPAKSSSGFSTPTLNSPGKMGPPPSGSGRAPFNFQTQTIKDGPIAANSVWQNDPSTSNPTSPYNPSSPFLLHVKFKDLEANKSPQNIGKRRGHRYKHSSVSAQHQIFLEPPPRSPLALPASLPIPTYREAWTSRSKEQNVRITWCACHILVAGYVLYSAAGSLALTALSHLIFFDAISAIICVVIDILCNFEVWKRSSIRHPFGLERAEVLAGFAMSVFLLFMGFDLISHNLKHVLESLGGHEPHHPHGHERVSPGSVDSAALLSIIATLISAIGLKNHARVGKTMRFAMISNLPSVLSNPSHFLTLSCSTIMLLLPLLSLPFYLWLDRLLCGVIAISMFILGIKLAMTQGLMLLMSYSGKGVSEVMKEIASDPHVTHVEEARFWQVHYGLCMANLKLRVVGDDGQLGRLRERVGLLVRNKLGGGYGKGSGVKWEVTVQMDVDK